MALSDVRDYLLCVENDKAEALRIAHKTATSLQARQSTLLEIVQSLGEYVNDEDSRIRGRAVSYLTAVLSALPPKVLSRQQIDVLCHFFSDRIEDGGAIDGLTKLQSWDRFTVDMAQTVIRAIFDHFRDFQSRPQSGRHQILQLLNELMSNHRKAVHLMGDESLVGFTTLVSGEKDPRNLMLVFSMCRVFMLEWDISKHAEILFDTVYAYFPITFRPPPNDPYGITAQDLKERLRDCLSATKTLAPYVIPNLLDKLDSTSSVVKKDVLSTLLACARSYDATCMSQYSIPLWDALKFEVLNAQEPELAQDTLVILQAIAKCVAGSKQTSSTASPLAQFLRPISKECIEHLQEPAHRQAKASGDILGYVSSATSDSFSMVIKAVIAPLITVYQSTSNIADRRALLEVVGRLLDSAIDVFGTWTSKTVDSGAENPLEAVSEKLLQIFSQALMSPGKEEVSFRVAAAQALRRLATIRGLLQDNEIGMIVQHLDELVLHGESYGRNDVKVSAMASLAEISKHKPRLIMDITLPAFMAELPDTDADAESRGDYATTLAGLAEISTEPEVFDTLLRRLLNKVDVLSNTDNFSTPKYTIALLSTVLFVMERKSTEKSMSAERFYDRVVVGLISRAAAAATEGNGLTALNDVSVLQVLGRLSNFIVRHSKLQQKTVACANVYNLFRSQSGLEELCQSPEDGQQRTLWILSTWLLAAIPRDLQAPLVETPSISQTLPRLLNLLEESVWTPPIIAVSRQVALFVNKHLPTSELDIATAQLSTIYFKLSSTSEQEDVDVQVGSANSTTRMIWMTFVISKALVLRLSQKTTTLLEDLVSLLDPSKYRPTVSKVAAAAFGSLLAPDPILSKANGAQIRLLVPQKVFNALIPLISTGFKSSSLPGPQKENYLIALGGVIATVPSDIVVPELPTLLPLLLQSLDLSDHRVKISTLETLTTVILRSPTALAESGHVSSLTKRLLAISSSAIIPTKSQQPHSQPPPLPPQPSPVPAPPKARQLSTRCLLLMPSHITTASSSSSSSRPNPLLPLKRQVLQTLAKVLDDPKRDVRKEAVDARAAWLRGVDDDDDDGEDSD